MADKRWRGAVFDVFVAVGLAVSVSWVSAWAAIPLASAGKALLVRMGWL